MRGMRRLLVLIALLTLGRQAEGDPPAPGPKPGEPPQTVPAPPAQRPPPAANPASPLTPEQAADAVLAAVKAKDDAALKLLALKDDPDPWLVADELIRRAEHDAAGAFAKAAPRVDVEALPAYITAQRGKPSDAARRERFAAAKASLAANAPHEALGALGAPSSPVPSDVIGVRMAMGRGLALIGLAHPREASEAFRLAAEAAEMLGWIAQSVRAYYEAGSSADSGSSFADSLSAFEHQLRLSERRSNQWSAAAALGNIANVYYRIGDFAKALATHERALAAKEAIGDKVGAATTLGNIGAVQQARGEYAKALSAFERAFRTMEILADKPGMAWALANLGVAQSARRDYSGALSTYERALSLNEELGDKAGAATTLRLIGNVHYAAGDRAKALSALERALAANEALGDKAGAARTLASIGVVHSARGEHAKALSSHERALATLEAIGDRETAAATLSNIGIVHCALGDYVKALSVHKRALAAQEAVEDKAGAAWTLHGIGNIHQSRGDYPEALSNYERSRAAHESLGNEAEAASTLGDIGSVYLMMGEYAKALSIFERVLEAQNALVDKAGAAKTLGNIGNVYYDLGDHAKALSSFERALEAFEMLGEKGGTAAALSNVGMVHDALGDHAKAMLTYERALEALVALGDKARAAATLGNLGSVHYALGNHTKALSIFERSLRELEILGDKAGAAVALGNIGSALLELGDYARALSTYERALVAQDALADRASATQTLSNIGKVYFELKDYAKAMTFARRAVGEAWTLARGLGSEEGASARERFSSAFDIGMRAAIAVGKVSDFAFFLESGRAGSLLEGLNARETLWTAAVPQEYRIEEIQARAAQTAATQALRRSLDVGGRSDVQARRSEFEEASDRVSAVIARIQREAKAGAALLHPEVVSLDAIRATLGPGDALLLFTLHERDASVLVLTRDGARIVSLGASTAIVEASQALAFEGAGPDLADALARLAKLTVAPLGLPSTTTRVLVSPAGALSYVPFAALLPDLTVAYVPSGTTYALLLEDQIARGEGVLALGDPDYRTKVDEYALAVNRSGFGRLSPLPATRAEAKAVGTATLLGNEATEAGLRDAIAKRSRWRSVHLACHGLVDPERPMRSSLALTAASDDDGFLTCLDVFRMKIPADLVVLSACETGKGKVLKSEGIVGMTRAFMFAGAPRVICSLWKVDDEATRALMVKFYELWNPKDPSKAIGTAAALKAAQEYVRTREVEVVDTAASQREGRTVTKRARPWEHPYYWAAWVLWGLPS